MKSIVNKETTIAKSEEQGKPTGNLFYSDLISTCLRQAKTGGLDYNDIENRLAISKVVKDANGTLELEDAQFTYLKKLVESMKWGMFHEDILNFKNDITAIK